MAQLYHFKDYHYRALPGLTSAETFELDLLEKIAPTLTEWNGYTLRPISEREKRWAFLSQKYIDAQPAKIRQRQESASGDSEYRRTV